MIKWIKSFFYKEVTNEFDKFEQYLDSIGWEWERDDNEEMESTDSNTGV